MIPSELGLRAASGAITIIRRTGVSGPAEHHGNNL